MKRPADHSRLRTAAALAVLLAAALGPAGCGQRPVAPALQDSPVYENEREGFRFLAPEGWTLHARSEGPPRKDKERLLAEYKRLTGGRGATLEVTFAVLPEPTDLAARLAGPSHGIKSWSAAASPESLSVNGVPATRHVHSTRVGQEELIKEAVVFRRGERVYFFTGFYAKSDPKTRDQIRRAVGSTIWKS